MRNFNVDLLRIVFAFFIVYAHMGLLKMVPAGFLCGPLLLFFFGLTGYFTMAGYEKRKNQGQTMGGFLIGKIKSFLPYLIVAGIVTFVLQTILQIDYYGYTLSESIVSSLLTFFADVSCLDMFDMPFVMGNVAVWYLSGMILGLAVTYPFIMKFGHSFSKYAAPIIGIICVAVSLRLSGTLFGPYDDFGGVTKGMVESIGMICLGYFVYECVVKVKGIRFTNLGKVLLTIVEIGCYALFIAMMFLWSSIYTGHLVGHFSQEWYEFIMCILVLVAMTLTCSGITYLAIDISMNPNLAKLSSFLATASLVLYLSNYYQIYFVGKMMKKQLFSEQLFMVICYVAVSFVIVYVGGKILQKAGKGLKSKLIVQEEGENGS